VKIRILIADDHKLFRDGLRELINGQADMEVVGEAENGQTAITLARELQPDVVLMDVKMPVLDGMAAARRIHSEMPGMKIVALSAYSGYSFSSGMMRAGIAGYIVKGHNVDELYKVIRKAAGSKNS
jgi:YesN/AraC family two-component response regulator